MAKRWQSTKMRGPKVRLPKQAKAKVPKPKPNTLAEAYRRTLTANTSARINAYFEAIKWWDDAIPFYISQKPLTADQIKSFERANKVRSQAIHAGNTSTSVPDAERITFLERTILLYEKIWAANKPTSLQPFVDRFNAAKAELEAREAALASRFKYVLDSLNTAFKPVGIEFAVQKSEHARQFDGLNKILISRELAKTLAEKARKEGLLPVIFSEANTVLKAASLQKGPDGTSAMDFGRYYQLVPTVMQNIMQFCGTIERSKVFRACPEVLEATPGTVAAQHTPKAPRTPRPAGAAVPRGPRVRQQGPLVGGRFQPGSAMALLFEALQDQKSKALADVLGKLAVGDPLGRVKSMMKIGQQTGKWTVKLSKDSVQMTIN